MAHLGSKLRYCKSIGCDKLKGIECSAKKCINEDADEAVKKRLAELKAVKNGR